MPFLKITWRRSLIGRHWRQRRVIQALGLRRLSDIVVHRDSPGIRGMLQKVPHLVEVEEVESDPRDVSQEGRQST